MIKKTIAGMLAISTLIAALPITAATTVSAEGSYTVPELSLENKSVPETDSMKKSLDDMFDTLYVAFVQQNIPVVIGELGATNRNNTQAKTDQTAYYYAAARARGISCCLWDNSNAEGDNEAYRFLDRTNKTFIYDSITAAAKKYGAPRSGFGGGGGALCFNLNVDGKGYWIGYPFRAGVEWDSAQNKNVPVPCTVDLTDTSQMNVNCWSENRKVTDTAELKMLSKLCQASTSAEIQLWWSLNLDWGDRPDSSVTAGKSESEVSDLKAAAAKECIAVINVRPMSLPLDNNMGKGSWNNGGDVTPGTTVPGTQDTNETTTTTTNTDVQPPAGDTLFHVWMAGSIGVDDFWGNGNKGQTAANITGNGTYTASFQVSSEADTISCLVLDSDIDIFKYASKDSADPIADSGIQMKIESVMVDGKPISYTGPSDGAYRLGDSGTSLRYNILNTWTPTNKVSDIASKVKVSKSVSVKFTISGLPDSGVTTSESKPGTTESSTQTTVSSSETTTVSQKTTTTAETSSATATTEKAQSSETSTSATTTASSAKPSETTTESTVLASIFGDINLDSKVDISDAVLLNKKAAGQVDLNAQATANADCNSDKEVNGEDAIVLLQFLVQIIKTLPATK